MEEHIHCKICKRPFDYCEVEKTILGWTKASILYCELNICPICVIEEGIISLQKKTKKKT